MFPLPSTRTFEAGFPSEARIPGFWDSAVLVKSGIGAETVCFFLPQCRPEDQYQSQGAAQEPSAIHTTERGQGMG